MSRNSSDGPDLVSAPGNSSTALAKKLGIKPGNIILTIGAPADYAEWLRPLPADVVIASDARDGTCAIVHLFVTRCADLERGLARARRAMSIDGAIWVSWYKNAAKIPTDVTESLVRESALATDLVDIKICAVNEIWSGLKLVVRKHLR